MLILLGSYLLLVFVLPVTLSALISWRALPIGRSCGQCGSDTVAVCSRWSRLLSRLLRRPAVQRRWCMGCGWEGVVRLPRSARPAPAVSSVRTDVLRQVTQTLDVRSVTVDGQPFRVMLQCWNRGVGFCGRLMFVGPAGRLWLDSVESFSGTNENEVLGQALSLPDGLLQNRLRRLVSQR